ncbi:RNA polymerase sigma factor [Nonomuraea sp. NPDC051191]|uniref:RNA polymerase sigma factor n=1 Tax=Nonomuraea sp. NPDC051191 TaxID=3364372 RepID=UPI00378F6E7F
MAPKQRFEEIYTAHYPAVATYVRRRTVHPEDIADVIAETFTVAWRRIGDVPAGDEARLWLYCVARRVLANHFRAEERRSALAGRLRDEFQAQEPQDDVVVRETGAAYRAFRQLSDDDRELLSLVAWEGLGSKEIAKVLDCSRGAVRLRLHRARKRFATALADAHMDLSPFGERAVALAERQS